MQHYSHEIFVFVHVNFFENRWGVNEEIFIFPLSSISFVFLWLAVELYLHRKFGLIDHHPEYDSHWAILVQQCAYLLKIGKSDRNNDLGLTLNDSINDSYLFKTACTLYIKHYKNWTFKIGWYIASTCVPNFFLQPSNQSFVVISDICRSCSVRTDFLFHYSLILYMESLWQLTQ